MAKVKETTKTYGKITTYIREFDSLNSFYEYITTTPLNKTFCWKKGGLSSTEGSKGFTGTESFEEAVGLFKNGWDDMAKKLTKKLNVQPNCSVTSYVQKTVYDIVGFQCSVPRYLQGIPTNMVNKRLTPVKQKVVTLNKDFTYNSKTSTEDIIEASIQTMQVVKMIEAQGIRVNLNIIFGVKGGLNAKTKEVCKIRVKSANERVNISKLAFPLVNPSMFRRLCFRYIEVAPTITDVYKYGYGMPLDGSELKQYCKGEYVLPRLFDGDLSQLGDLSTICNLTDQIVNGKNDKPKTW